MILCRIIVVLCCTLAFIYVQMLLGISNCLAGVVRLKRSLQIEEEVAEPFIADRPCLWLLKHNPSGLWLFFGRLSRPDYSSQRSLQERDEL